MSRIIFVPQFPSEMRYQEWWFWKLPQEFSDRGFEVLTLGQDYANMMVHRRGDLDMFSPINQAIELETAQINEYMKLDLRDDDILFWSDISFPGLFGHVLFHKRPKRMYAFCHATSKNKYDYYEKDRQQKFPIETSICQLFDKIFVGSEYHKRKLDWGDNVIVTYLPFPPMSFNIKTKKIVDIISVSRPSIQKVDLKLETYIEESFDLEIKRPISSTWYDYHLNLASSRILLITSNEDTFGYQIVDAVINGCIPLARNCLSYPELLPEEYLYKSKEELGQKIDYILNADFSIVPEVDVPKLLCEEEMKNFYDVICDEMR